MIIEMFLLIKVGGWLGAVPTIALVFVTAALGLWMMRLQGASTLRRASLAVSQGEAPVREAATGAILLVGAVLLIIPGFFTDFLGLLCLFPPTRALLLRRFKNNVQIHDIAAFRQVRGQRRSRIIEGEIERD